MTSHRIAVLPGDGIGKEVIAAGSEVLRALAAREPGLDLELQAFDWGSDYYRAHGRMMPDDGLDQLRGFDAIYFGAVGAPDIPDDVMCGACASRSARASISTRMSGRRGSCRAS